MPESLIKIQNVGKSYRTKKEALIDINFEIQHGEILCILGVNGAGKTTLCSLLASLHPASEGSILWQNKSIYQNLIEYRKLIGFCPQDQNLDFHLVLQQNLIYQGRYYGLTGLEAKSKARSLIQQFELQEYAESSILDLSGGYKQRFLIARSLMHRPRFLILDEPTAGLDPLARQNLWSHIRSLKQEGLTILFTTHYLQEAEMFADRVCVIHEGRLKFIDTPQSLMEKSQREDLESAFLQLLKKGAE